MLCLASDSEIQIPLKLLRETRIIGQVLVNINHIVGNKEQKSEQIPIQTQSKTTIPLHLLPNNYIDPAYNYRIRVTLFQIIDEIEKEIQMEIILKLNEIQERKTISSDEYGIINQQVLFCLNQNISSEQLLIQKNEESFKIKLSDLNEFEPMNIQLTFSDQSKLYFSLILENMNDNLVEIIVKDFQVQSYIDNFELNRFVLSLIKSSQFVQFTQFTPISINDQTPNTTVFSLNSTFLKIPFSYIENLYQGIAYFCVPQKLILQKLKLGIFLQQYKAFIPDSKFQDPNFNLQLNAICSFQDLDLSLEFKTDFIKKSLDFEIQNIEGVEEGIITSIKSFKCLIEYRMITKENLLMNLEKQKPLKMDQKFEEKNLSEIELKLLSENLQSALLVANDNQKWKILSKEVSQKQDLIAQFMQEYEEKQNTMKKTVNQIQILKQELIFIRDENKKLKKRLEIDGSIEVRETLEQELINMNEEELRLKLIRVAQSFQDEREKNQQYEKALQKAHQDLIEAKELQQVLDKLQNEHLEKNKELLKMQKEINKVKMYDQTLETQNQVIKSLEENLEKCVERQQKHHKLLSSIQQVEKENEEIKKTIENQFQNLDTDPEVIELRKQAEQLELIKQQIFLDLERKNPILQEDQQIQTEKNMLEIDILKYTKRIEALERELMKNTIQQADELVLLENTLAKKQLIF